MRGNAGESLVAAVVRGFLHWLCWSTWGQLISRAERLNQRVICMCAEKGRRRGKEGIEVETVTVTVTREGKVGVEVGHRRLFNRQQSRASLASCLLIYATLLQPPATSKTVKSLPTDTTTSTAWGVGNVSWEGRFTVTGSSATVCASKVHIAVVAI